MPGPEEIAAVVAEWIAKAENDLKTATFTLRLGKACPTDTVCFHAQQVVEEYLKALLTHRQRPFPKTHNVQALVGMLSPAYQIDLSEEQQYRLTDYATVARLSGVGRYPLTGSPAGGGGRPPRAESGSRGPAQANPTPQETRMSRSVPCLN